MSFEDTGPRPEEELRQSFLRVWPMLEKAVAAYGPTHEKEHVWERIRTGKAQIWTTENAVILTTIEVWPTGFKELCFWLAGGDLTEALELKPHIEQWGKEKGCDRVNVFGRAGWGRVLDDYQRIAVTLVKDLKKNG